MKWIVGIALMTPGIAVFAYAYQTCSLCKSLTDAMMSMLASVLVIGMFACGVIVLRSK